MKLLAILAASIVGFNPLADLPHIESTHYGVEIWSCGDGKFFYLKEKIDIDVRDKLMRKWIAPNNPTIIILDDPYENGPYTIRNLWCNPTPSWTQTYTQNN